MRNTFFIAVLLLASFVAISQGSQLQSKLDSLLAAGNFPGLSVAISIGDRPAFALAAGFNDRENKVPMKASDRLLQGSVGKTYASAIALKLVKDGKLDLDKKVSDYLGNHAWYRRVPNAETITVRMLMNHSSGVMRYEFKPQFTRDLTDSPMKVWRPEDLLAYVLDEKAGFAAGEGWEYSDTNYILLGMIIEQLTAQKYYDVVKRELLVPFNLKETFPSDSRKLAGLSQGYAGESNEFGGKDRVIGDDGLFIINPQFEWTGGGIYSTTLDLVKWGKLLYENKYADTSLLLHGAVPAKLGRDAKYGLGVIIRPTPQGITYGHSGFFPGYMTEMMYFPADRLCIAVQCNSSDFKNLKLSLVRVALEMAKIARESK